MLTAVSAWDLARFSGGRFALGLASQVRGNIVDRYGAEWSEPVARLGDYVAAVRAVFRSFRTGDPLRHEGPHYRLTRLQPYFNPGPLDDEAHEPSLWTGGVNPRMCRLAGEVSDGFVCHPTNSHPEVIRRHVLPAVEEGRRASALPGRRPFLVAGPQPVTAADSAGLARAVQARRSELAFLYSTPAYRLQLETFGLEGLGERLSALVQEQRWGDLEGILTDEVVSRLVPVAVHAELPGLLRRWYADLADGIVLALPEADTPDALDDTALAGLVEACRAI
ncbi:LLM class flavin-dependent oxidoreductase [Nocardioides alcanivorans]|uniref:LLM class flavin-dependent oxidoreductase n=1 Tax=Nocardioides alcanivorans TaxID=2897352 RepID=UPI0024B10666|nr:LLM class flavin-dependent oxidoreductase [Nocardioides alcanivorans]